jgi:hypothetical protein
MKINLVLLLAASFANPASAVVLTQFISTDVPSNLTSPIPANDWVDGINVMSIVGHGTVTKNTSDGSFGGWQSTMSLLDYVGFGISADPGQILRIDDIVHGVGSSEAGGPRMGSWTMGYRIDADGSGPGTYGNWILENPLVFGDTNFDAEYPTSSRVWDLDIQTTGSVEFGFFGTQNVRNTATLYLLSNPGSMTVNGTVSPIPEPSAAALGLLGSLAFFRRRR